MLRLRPRVYTPAVMRNDYTQVHTHRNTRAQHLMRPSVESDFDIALGGDFGRYSIKSSVPSQDI